MANSKPDARDGKRQVAVRIVDARNVGLHPRIDDVDEVPGDVERDADGPDDHEAGQEIVAQARAQVDSRASRRAPAWQARPSGRLSALAISALRSPARPAWPWRAWSVLHSPRSSHPDRYDTSRAGQFRHSPHCRTTWACGKPDGRSYGKCGLGGLPQKAPDVSLQTAMARYCVTVRQSKPAALEPWRTAAWVSCSGRKGPNPHAVERPHVAEHGLIDFRFTRGRERQHGRVWPWPPGERFLLRPRRCASCTRYLPTACGGGAGRRQRPARDSVADRLGLGPGSCSTRRWRHAARSRWRGRAARASRLVDGAARRRWRSVGWRPAMPTAEPVLEPVAATLPRSGRVAGSCLQVSLRHPSSCASGRCFGCLRGCCFATQRSSDLAALGQAGLGVGAGALLQRIAGRSSAVSPPLSQSALVRSEIACAGLLCWR